MKNKTTSLFRLFILLLAIAMFHSQSSATHYELYYKRNGDVNLNGFTSIEDLTYLIDHILSGEVSKTDDIDGNLTVDISDAMSLANYLLNGEYIFDLSYPPIPDSALVVTVNGESFAMMPVKGGIFDGRIDHSREVKLSDFHIGMTEVTVGLWYAVMGDVPVQYTGYTPRFNEPVRSACWIQCYEFVCKLNELTGYHFVIPSRFYWQYAAIGGQYSHGYNYAGSNDIDEVAWYKDNLPELYVRYLEDPHANNCALPVGLKKPNELGLYDMSGNIAEYVDFYAPGGSYVYAIEEGLDQFPPESFGGCVWWNSDFCNPYKIFSEYSATSHSPETGFRLALMDSTLTR